MVKRKRSGTTFMFVTVSTLVSCAYSYFILKSSLINRTYAESPFMVRQAHHERLNLISFVLSLSKGVLICISPIRPS